MGLSAADRDPTTDPAVDFYRFANGGWLDANPIPAGYGAWGALEELTTHNEHILREILERATHEPANKLDRMLGDYYSAGMDLAGIESDGLAPIQPFLDAIDHVTDEGALLALLPTLHRSGIFALFGWTVTPDFEDTTQNLFWLTQGGLGLPDRESYLSQEEVPQELRTAYHAHVQVQLSNIGEPSDSSDSLATSVLEFETRLAELHLPAAQLRDPDKTLNRHDLNSLHERAPDLGLKAYLRDLGAGEALSVNVQSPDSLAGLYDIIASTDAATLRAYLRFHVVKAMAEALPAVIDDESFAFYGRRIRGQQEQKERYKRIIAALTADMGEALSQRFVDVAFPPEAHTRAHKLVLAIKDEMRQSLLTRQWMSDETRERGLIKLDAMAVKIGYPDKWRDWSELSVSHSSYGFNRLNAARFEIDRLLAKIGRPVEASEWEMPPHMVNAYYHPTRNEIVFPAGILQPPLFDAAADDAVNFGGIGTVIGHEITHGFDDEGGRFDADGSFRDWWTPKDRERFRSLADRVVAQFREYPAVADVPVNGQLTLGENIADLGGLALAYRALVRVDADHPDIDGLSRDQRFFLANAMAWRANVSEELARTLAQIDPHSPRRLRVIGPVSNLTAFQEAFALPDDAPVLRQLEERIEIW